MEPSAYEEMYQQEDSHWWYRGRRHVIAALIGRVALPEGARILDAGCGTGRNMVDLAALGAVRGVDVSEVAVAYCRARGVHEVQQAAIDGLPFEDGEFDLVAAYDVIEHVEQDGQALGELRRVTRPGGVLLATVPAYSWMWSEHDVQLHHFRRYNARVFCQRARSAGWLVERATYFNTLLLPLAAAVRLLSRLSARPGRTDLDRTPPLLNRLLELPMRLEALAIGLGARLPAGVSLAVLCRNPAPASAQHAQHAQHPQHSAIDSAADDS